MPDLSEIAPDLAGFALLLAFVLWQLFRVGAATDENRRGISGTVKRLHEKLELWIPPWLTLLFTAVWSILLVALIAGLFWTIIQVPLRVYEIGADASISEEAAKEQAVDLRWYLLTLTAITAALGAVVALPFTIARTFMNRAQTETAEQGMITDRINKAVEGLGAEKVRKTEFRYIEYVDGVSSEPNRTRMMRGRPLRLPEELIVKQEDWQTVEDTVPNLEVRIGAIYALERISQDSPRDHIQIMEILCAYVRENAKAEDAEDRTARKGARRERFGGHATPANAWTWAQGFEPRTDIQAALRVIGRRAPDRVADERRDSRHGKGGYRLDLRETNLQGCYLSGLDLRRARLENARIEGAYLFEVGMEGAILVNARMVGAILIGARIEGAILFGAKMQGADLGSARMEGADFSGAQMEGANLRRARMEGAILDLARMEGANLRGARMDASTAFSPATLRGAGLKAVDYTELTTFPDDLSEVFGDASVRLPEHVARPGHWPDEDLDFQDWLERWRAWQVEIGYFPEED